MAKTRKSILKRMRMTSSGKILHGGSGINHFQAKKSRRKQLTKKRSAQLDVIQKKMVKSYLYH
ncbi:MAG: 50S ribosomal protein L35 [Candidatus Giovannonibacteria bacterium]|nr:MAG: 50S ribosomal protein L35 [Candidatus Giovannonibacteria bacterium]